MAIYTLPQLFQSDGIAPLELLQPSFDGGHRLGVFEEILSRFSLGQSFGYLDQEFHILIG